MESRRQSCCRSGGTCERYSVTEARIFSGLRDKRQRGDPESTGKNTHLRGPTATSTSHFVLFKAIGQCAKTSKSNKKLIKIFDCSVRSTTLTVALKEGIVASTALVLEVEAFKSSVVPSWGITSIATGYFVSMTFSCVRSRTMDAQ